MFKTTSEYFTISYGNPKHSVSATAYANSLLALNQLVKEIGRQSKKGLCNAHLEICAEKEGSFETLLALVAAFANPQNMESVSLAIKWIFEVLIGFLTLKKKLNESPQNSVRISGENVQIINGDNAVIYSPNINIYNFCQTNQKANNAVTKLFKAVKSDDEIEAFSIQIDNLESVTFYRDEFETLSKKNDTPRGLDGIKKG